MSHGWPSAHCCSSQLRPTSGTPQAEYTIHYNTRRPHQSLDQRYPDADTAIPAPVIDLSGRPIKPRPILGGLINGYEAA